MLVAEEENVEDGEGVVRPSKEIWPQAQWNQVYLSFFLYLYLCICVCVCSKIIWPQAQCRQVSYLVKIRGK